MSIELLWLVPIIAAALFLPVIVFARQKRVADREVDEQTQDLAREVDRFNTAGVAVSPTHAEKRLSDIELTISRVSSALSTQQKIIEDFRGKDVGHENEFLDLKEKLRELQREYDIVISENYSLRAKVKRLVEERTVANAAHNSAAAPGSEIRGPGQVDEGQKQVNMQMYDDTRMFHASDLNDTSEINLSELR